MPRTRSKAGKDRTLHDLERLVAQRCANRRPSPEELALLAFVHCSGLEKAVDALVKERTRLADLWGAVTVDDALAILKIWIADLDPLGQTALYNAVARQLGVIEMDTEVPLVIGEGTATFLRDLPSLMSEHAKEWVAYRGSQRVAMGASDREVLELCVAQHLPEEELVVRRIQPDIPSIDTTW